MREQGARQQGMRQKCTGRQDMRQKPNEWKRRQEYEDMLDLPHHVSEHHPPMSRLDRAAQFAPFAALTGHSAAIQETARLARERAERENIAEMEWDSI